MRLTNGIEEKMNLKDKLTLVISSCEGYSDLWNNHVDLLNENWPDRSIDTVIVTDKIHEAKFSNVRVFPAGDSLEMPQRLYEFARTCETKYLLITLDDYYLDRPVDVNKINRAIKLMERLHLDYLRFWPYPHERKKIKGVKKAFWIDLNGNYKVNLYPAIWKRTFLKNTVKSNLSAWEYEVSLTNLAKTLNARCAYSINDEFHIVDIIRKGKLLHPAKRFLDSKGMSLDRELIERKQEWKLSLMYYGKEIIPKPILRQIKNMFIKRGHKFISEDI